MFNLGTIRKAVVIAFAVAAIIVTNHGWGDSIWWIDALGVAGVFGVYLTPNKSA